MKTAHFCTVAGLAFLSCLGGCHTDRRLANIEGSARKTGDQIEDLNEKTNAQLGSLNENTDGFNRNLDALDAEVAELRKRLAATQDELEKVRLELEILTLSGQSTYQDLRKAQTATLRNEFWKAFQEPSSLEARVVNASKFLASLEHRFWKPELESSEARESLLRSDLVEVFGNLTALVPDFAHVPLFAFPRSTVQEQLFGFSLALVEPGMAASKEGFGLETLFLTALELEASVEAGQTPTEALKPFERVLLANAAGIKNLLLIRTNALAAYFVAQTSEISRSFPWNWLEKNRLQLGAWVADTSTKSLLELEELTRTIRNALSLEKTLGALRETGAVLVSDLRQILGNCRISESRSLAESTPVRNEALLSLQGALRELASQP